MIIYRTTNLINGHTYIGQTKRTGKAYQHYFGGGKLLKAALRKYGRENFSKTILYRAKTQAELDQAEINFITIERIAGKAEYNIANGGVGAVSVSEEKKKKKKKGKIVHEENKRKMRAAKKRMTEETRRKMSEAKKCTKYYNNGTVNVRCKECPDGFVPGRIKKRV